MRTLNIAVLLTIILPSLALAQQPKANIPHRWLMHRVAISADGKTLASVMLQEQSVQLRKRCENGDTLDKHRCINILKLKCTFTLRFSHLSLLAHRVEGKAVATKI